MIQDVTASDSRQDRFAGRICTSSLKQQLKVWIRPTVVVLVMLLFTIPTHTTLTASEQPTPQAPPEVHTIWTFINEYTGADKSTRLLNSFAIGYMDGCRGTLIAPHIFMTTAHCGNPDYVTRTVTFFSIDEDTLSGPNSQTTGDTFQARPLPWHPLLDASDRQHEDVQLWWLDDGHDGVPPGNKYGYIALGAEENTTGAARAYVAVADANRNDVVDLIEYDLFLTPAVRDFYHLTFATPIQRAQWQPAPAATSSTAAGPALQVGHVGGKLIGPFAYRTAADSPFHNQDLILEDFEDGRFIMPGVTASAGAPLGPGPTTDSVDGDDGATADRSGRAGHSFFSIDGQAGITFRFDPAVIGALPTHVGLVWTDGAGETTFEALGADGNSLGAIGPLPIADDLYTGTINDDRFFGVMHNGGIAAIKLQNSSGGIEVDHLQYGVVAPLAGEHDGLWHTTAQFAPGATYRITLLVYGLAEDAAAPYVAFRADDGASHLFHFQPVLNEWRYLVGRVTLGNDPSYHLILGEDGGGSYYVDSIAIVREDQAAKFDFETDEERRAWEYASGAYVTAWGIAGANDFSGVVVGPSLVTPDRQWSLRNRYLGLQANKTYEIAFDVAHVAGPLHSDLFVKVQDRNGMSAAELSWRFTRAGERVTKVLHVTTQSAENAITFGAVGASSYMLDNVRIEEH